MSAIRDGSQRPHLNSSDVRTGGARSLGRLRYRRLPRGTGRLAAGRVRECLADRVQWIVVEPGRPGPTAFQLKLEPDHFAADYQGSSRIASRALPSAQVSSVAFTSSGCAPRCESRSRSRTAWRGAASASASLTSSTKR